MKLETFFEKFDQFADAPDAVAKMRGFVLDLAVQGRLSNQNATNENVESRYMDEPLSSNLPSNWRLLNFGKFCDIQGGNQPPKSQFSDQPRPGYVRLFQIRDLGERPVPVCIPEDSTKRFCREGEILIGRYGASVGKIFWARDGAYNVALAKFIYPEDALLPEFAFRVLKSHFFQAKIAGASRSAQAGFNKGDLASINFPLPPLAEQKRIVAKVDELMALCDRLEVQQKERDTRANGLARASLARFADAPTPANLNFLFHSSYHIPPADLRKSILTLAVQGKLVPQDPGDEAVEKLIERIKKLRAVEKAKVYDDVNHHEVPYNIPQSWKWVRLGSICLTSDSGWSPQCLPEPRTGTEWGVLKVSAVSWGTFKPDENKALPPEMEPRPGCEVKPGDFLLSRANTEDLVARSVVVVETPPHLMMSDKIVRFTFPDEIDRDFINLANSSSQARNHYAKNSSGTSSSMKNVGRGVMCALPVPIPPIAEQRRIVAKVNQLIALVDELETQLLESRTTAQHLLEALVAELTTESASSPAVSA
ncbi:MAG: restriction endonuclease subunit S [Verrucomicrobiota bacterium]